nr:putative PEP-binding protein [Paenibacillus xylanexedens]
MIKRVMLLEDGTAEMEGITPSIGAALAALREAGWSVPTGMVVTTDSCRACCARPGELSDEMNGEVGNAIRQLEQQTGKLFGHTDHPLLLHVQADSLVAPATAEACVIPYVGLNDDTVEGFARQTGNRVYALQCYLTEIQHYGHIKYGIAYPATVQPIDVQRSSGEAELEWSIAEWKQLILKKSGHPFPQDVRLQLQAAIHGVSFSKSKQGLSFSNQKESSVEILTSQPEPTAWPVFIHAVSQGKYSDLKGKGSVYTRNPATGERGIIGDFLPAESQSGMLHALSYLKRHDSERYTELETICTELEKRTGTVLEITYTVDSASICLEHIRSALLSPAAAIKSAVDLVIEGLIQPKHAILRMRSDHVAEGMKQEIPEMRRLLEWADEIKDISILAKVEETADALQVKAWGADGIGLCVTDAMFMSPHRKPFVQKMMLANTEEERRRGLERLLPMQQSDLEVLFEAMNGRPAAIRLFDFARYEFVPGRGEEDRHGDQLHIDLFELYEMQLEAVFRAAVRCIREGLWVRPEILIPHVEHAQEMQDIRELADHVAAQVLGEERRHCIYKVGAVISSPRAALTASQIARYADLILFAGDELSETTPGYMPEGAEQQQEDYATMLQTEPSPLRKLDIEGVGRLVEHAVAQSRLRKTHLKTVISGEHSRDVQSMALIQQIGLDAVCVRPEHIPWARVAAAQAVIRQVKEKQNTSEDEDISTIA